MGFKEKLRRERWTYPENHNYFSLFFAMIYLRKSKKPTPMQNHSKTWEMKIYDFLFIEQIHK